MEQISTYQQAREYLRSFVDFEKRGFRRHFADTVNLDTIRALLAELGNPEERFPCVHLAGTKGKGSTAALLEGALRAGGYRTGLYTSPHLVTMRERVRLGGEPISEERMLELIRQVQPVAESLRQREGFNPPTFFEIHTAVAFLAFAAEPVDLAIIETGLGGRLDATNVVSPLLTVITTVGWDHMDILGDTLEQIAGEKAGILKPGVPLVCGRQAPEAAGVIERRAAELGVEVRRPPRVAGAKRPQPLEPPAPGQPLRRPVQRVTIYSGEGDVRVRLPLLGRHQRENLALAWQAAQALGERGFPLEGKTFAAGMVGVRWPGRFEVVEARPWLVLDCAHNRPSLEALAETLPAALRYRRLILVYGMSGDKEVEAATAAIARRADAVVLTEALVPRALWVSELARRTWDLWGTTPHLSWTVREGLARARELAGPEDCICVAGSAFVVGEALEALGAAESGGG